MSKFKVYGFACVFLILLTISLFYPSLQFSFVNYDDPQILTSNRLVKNFDLYSMFFKPSPQVASGDYLPLTVLSFAIENYFFEMNPYTFHLSNLILHTINVLLLFLFLLKLTTNNKMAFVSAAIFAIHPLHIESVAWVTERKDLLCALFFLLSLLTYLKIKECEGENKNRGHLWVICFSTFILAVLAKAMALTLPLLFILIDFNCGKIKVSNKVLFLLAAIGFTLFHIHLHGIYDKGNLFYLGGPEEIMLGALSAIGFYLSRAVYPINLSVLYENPRGVLKSGEIIVAFLIFGTLLWGVLKASAANRKWIVFGLVFFIISILPTLQFFPYGTGFIFADRYFYLPSIGLFLSLSFLFLSLFKNEHFQKGILCLVFIGFFGLSNQRLSVWKDSETLWKDALAKFPNSSIALTNLGAVRYSQGRKSEAESLFKKSIDLNHDQPSAHSNLGVLYVSRGELELAIREYEQALALRPQSSLFHYNLGNVNVASGRIAQAIKAYTRAVEIDSQYVAAYFNLGSVFAQQRRWQDAIQIYEKILSFDPTQTRARENIKAITEIAKESH